MAETLISKNKLFEEVEGIFQWCWNLDDNEMMQILKNRGIIDGICIVGEPTNMKIIDAHKGCYEYTTYFEGLAGHGSAPEKGVNAVEYATRYISKLMDLREILKSKVPKNSVFDPPYTTIGIGGISGGIARNVFAD